VMELLGEWGSGGQWVEGSAFKERELREGVKREEWTYSDVKGSWVLRVWN
jgi:hypothetical protein